MKRYVVVTFAVVVLMAGVCSLRSSPTSQYLSFNEMKSIKGAGCDTDCEAISVCNAKAQVDAWCGSMPGGSACAYCDNYVIIEQCGLPHPETFYITCYYDPAVDCGWWWLGGTCSGANCTGATRSGTLRCGYVNQCNY